MLQTSNKNNTSAKNLSTSKWVNIGLVTIAIVTLIIYSGAAQFDYLLSWDDNLYIHANQDVKNFSLQNISFLCQNFYAGNYQPLTMLLYAIEYKLGSGSAEIFHIVNILIHIANALLVFLFIRKISPSNVWVALITASFFAIHPMHVESVAWVSETKDVLYTLFFLLSLIAYTNYARLQQNKFLYFSLIFFLLSCLSKSAAVILPLVLFLIDYYLNRDYKLKVVTEKIGFFAISLLFGIIALYSQKYSLQEMAPSMSLFEHIAIVSHSFINYVVKAVLPVNLSAVYTYPIELGKISLPLQYYLSILGVAVLVVFVIYSRKWGKDIMFGSLFFLISLLLVLQIIPVGAAIMADRYTYLPYTGIFFMVGKLYERIVSTPTQKKYVVMFANGILLLGFVSFSVLAFSRVKVWENDDTLFTDVLEKYPNSYISNHDRGVYSVQSVTYEAYQGNGLNKETSIKNGIQDFENALKYAITPAQKVSTYNNIGYAKYMIGDYEGAIQSLDKAIELDKNSTSSYMNRAFAKSSLKRYDESIADFDKAIQLNPKDSNVIANRAIVIERRDKDTTQNKAKLISSNHSN